MKHRSSIFSPKRLNYYSVSGCNIPPKRPSFSRAKLKLLPKLCRVMFILQYASTNRYIVSEKIRGFSRPKSSRNLAPDRLETKCESCEK